MADLSWSSRHGAGLSQTSSDSCVRPSVSVRREKLPTIHMIGSSKQVQSPRYRVEQRLVLLRLVLVHLRSSSGEYCCIPNVYAQRSQQGARWRQILVDAQRYLTCIRLLQAHPLGAPEGRR